MNTHISYVLVQSIYTHIHSQWYVCMGSYIYIYIYIYSYVYIYLYKYRDLYMYIHIKMYICTDTYVGFKYRVWEAHGSFCQRQAAVHLQYCQMCIGFELLIPLVFLFYSPKVAENMLKYAAFIWKFFFSFSCPEIQDFWPDPAWLMLIIFIQAAGSRHCTIFIQVMAETWSRKLWGTKTQCLAHFDSKPRQSG